MRYTTSCSLAVAVIYGLSASAAVADADGVDALPAATATATATAVASEVFTDVPMDDYDQPSVVFGRAVDLAGADIEPAMSALGAFSGSLPNGRPLAGGRLTSGFGMRYHPTLGGTRFHSGIDLAAPTGTPVMATSAGRIVGAGWGGGYGILVTVSHGGAVESRYAHLSAVAVRPGETVRQGQIIGYVGSTGRSTGPHLHYETRVGGRPADPGSRW